MLRDGPTGIDVNMDVTSYKQIHSTGWRVTLLSPQSL